jgi:hypothetical protein
MARASWLALPALAVGMAACDSDAAVNEWAGLWTSLEGGACHVRVFLRPAAGGAYEGFGDLIYDGEGVHDFPLTGAVNREGDLDLVGDHELYGRWALRIGGEPVYDPEGAFRATLTMPEPVEPCEVFLRHDPEGPAARPPPLRPSERRR